MFRLRNLRSRRGPRANGVGCRSLSDPLFGGGEPHGGKAMRTTMVLVFSVAGLTFATGCGGGSATVPPVPVGSAPAKNYAQAIEAVLAQAEHAGKEAEQAHSFLSTSKILKKVRDAYQAIDLRECPSDFQSAFLSYVTTIENFIPFSEKYDDISFYSAFVNTTELLSLGPGRLPQVTEEGNRLRQALLSARQKVKEVGLAYNANVNTDY